MAIFYCLIICYCLKLTSTDTPGPICPVIAVMTENNCVVFSPHEFSLISVFVH